jgi:hypothetical protein
MGFTSWQSTWQFLRVCFAATALALGPLLLLEDLDFLLRELLVSPKFWPDWVSLPISLAFGIVVATWVRLRRQEEAAQRWEILAQRVTRHLLFLILFPYALAKVLRVQFRLPYVTLDTPLGDVSGFTLAWRFFGYSHAHEVFVALGEWIGPALLLFWRTTTLGACVTAVVMVNVVLVNFTHDLPVQRFSSCLLALTLYLLLFDGKRLLDFFVLNQPVHPRSFPAALIQSRWLSAAAKVGWVALALVYSIAVIAVGDSRPTPIAGAWTVESIGVKPAVGWQTVYFERGLKDSYRGSIRREAGSKPERFHYEVDPTQQYVRITFLEPASAEKSFDGSYEVHEGERLSLRGVLDNQAVEIRLLRKR